jgi:hypothetical protein
MADFSFCLDCLATGHDVFCDCLCTGNVPDKFDPEQRAGPFGDSHFGSSGRFFKDDCDIVL